MSDTATYAMYAGIGAVVLLLISLLIMYNRFVRQRTHVEESWGGIDVELTRRHQLVPNLVETVRGYAAPEEKVLTEVTQARAEAMAAQTPPERIAGEAHLTGALGELRAVAENYPQLQAVQEFKDLSENLTATEDKIAFARRFYNGNVRDYNTALQTFPTNLFASMLGFTAEEYFELTEAAEREVPKVKF